MANRLTKRQQGFVEDFVESGNGTEAAMKNYNASSENTAAAISSQNLMKPKIIEAIKSIAESIPDDKLLKVHMDGLEATEKRGEEEVADYAVRHKYLDSAYKLKGVYAAEKTINLNINQETTPELIEKAKQFDQWFKKQQTSKT